MLILTIIFDVMYGKPERCNSWPVWAYKHASALYFPQAAAAFVVQLLFIKRYSQQVSIGLGLKQSFIEFQSQDLFFQAISFACETGRCWNSRNWISSNFVFHHVTAGDGGYLSMPSIFLISLPRSYHAFSSLSWTYWVITRHQYVPSSPIVLKMVIFFPVESELGNMLSCCTTRNRSGFPTH